MADIIDRREQKQQVVFSSPGPPLSHPLISDKITLRRSIILLVLDLLIIEIACDAIYLLLRLPLMIFPLPQVLHIQTQLSTFYIFLFFGVNAIKFFCMFVVVLEWIACKYQIFKGEVKEVKGILMHQEKVFLFSYTQEVTVTQDIMGRICNYGTIEIFNPAIHEHIYLYAVPNPQKYAEVIRRELPEEHKQKEEYERARQKGIV